MSTYYEKTQEVVVADGIQEFALKFAHRGELRKLVVSQLDGSLDGFTFELFNSKRAVPDLGGSSSSSASSAAVGPSEDAFRVLALATCAAAADKISQLDLLASYTNTDGTPSNHIRRLYCRIVPSGSGDKTFAITLGADTSDF